MAWRELTLADVSGTLSQTEINQFRKSPDFTTQVDPVQDLIKRTAQMVRGYIRKNRQIKMSPSPYEVPESTISPTMDYLAFDVLKRFPVPITEDRKRAREQALEYFKAIASNETTVESYQEDEDERNAALPQFCPARRKILNERL